jgi:hypothetical protein
MKFWVSVELLCLGIGALLPAVTAAQGTSETRPVLHVSVLDDTGVGTNMLRKAERQASRVFRRANIDVVWLQCPQDSSQPTSVGDCSEASYPAHLHLRVVMRPRGVKESILGMAFQSGDGKGCYADLFQDRTLALQEESHVDAAIILGHAMAHELGHLLLGTNSHSRDGLMRAHWEPGDLAQAAKGNLLFSSEQSSRMRSRFTRDDSERLAVLVQEEREGGR